MHIDSSILSDNSLIEKPVLSFAFAHHVILCKDSFEILLLQSCVWLFIKEARFQNRNDQPILKASTVYHDGKRKMQNILA